MPVSSVMPIIRLVANNCEQLQFAAASAQLADGFGSAFGEFLPTFINVIIGACLLLIVMFPAAIMVDTLNRRKTHRTSA